MAEEARKPESGQTGKRAPVAPAIDRMRKAQSTSRQIFDNEIARNIKTQGTLSTNATIVLEQLALHRKHFGTEREQIKAKGEKRKREALENKANKATAAVQANIKGDEFPRRAVQDALSNVCGLLKSYKSLLQVQQVGGDSADRVVVTNLLACISNSGIMNSVDKTKAEVKTEGEEPDTQDGVQVKIEGDEEEKPPPPGIESLDPSPTGDPSDDS
jgi:hypothetical protein